MIYIYIGSVCGVTLVKFNNVVYEFQMNDIVSVLLKGFKNSTEAIFQATRLIV